MELILEVCDVCGKKHGVMLKREGVIFGDRRCFLDFCNSIWLRWEREEFEARGVVAKKESTIQEEHATVAKRIVNEMAMSSNSKVVQYVNNSLKKENKN